MKFFDLPKPEQDDIVAEYFRRTPLGQVAVPLKALKEAEYAHRLANRGFAPKEVFELLLGPVTVSVQIVHEVRDASGERLGFALRLREASEAGDAYQGLYHNTCCSFRWLDNLTTATNRDDSDAFAGMHTTPLEELGVTLHHETPRQNMDMTFMHRRVISMSDIGKMNGTWKFFSDEEIRAHHPDIIASNWDQLEWVMDEERPKFGVLKGTFPAELG